MQHDAMSAGPDAGNGRGTEAHNPSAFQTLNSRASTDISKTMMERVLALAAAALLLAHGEPHV